MTHIWPAINASLNALSGVFLLIAFLLIRRKRIQPHKRFMLAACTSSLVFLASYLAYHYTAGATRFAGVGWSRPVYFTLLLTHTVLAVVIVPLAVISVFNGLKMRVPTHRRFAKVTFPLWMYVSVTGVLVYVLLYQPTWLI